LGRTANWISYSGHSRYSHLSFVSFVHEALVLYEVDLDVAFIFFFFQKDFPFIISVYISLSCWHLFSVYIIRLPCKLLLCLYPVSKVQTVVLLFHHTQNEMLCAITHHSISRLTAQSRASLENSEYNFFLIYSASVIYEMEQHLPVLYSVCIKYLGTFEAWLPQAKTRKNSYHYVSKTFFELHTNSVLTSVL